jgi:glycosyltransferase involved in cell wall biosynthesis
VQLVLTSLKKIPIFDKQKKSYIYNGIDTTNRILKVKKNIVSSKKNQILLLSNYGSNKGIIFAIDVLKIVLKKNNCELIIAGDSKKDEYNLVERYINNLNLKKFVKLKKFEKNVFNLIKKTNILIVTTRNYEAFNYSIIEAMAMKKPVIASKVGGISEIVRHMETGFLINKNNKLQFAKCINLLLKNKKLSKKYGNAGYLRYKNNFLSEKMSIKYYNAITS